MGKDIQPLYTEVRPGDVKHSFADIERIRKYLNYQPNVLFQEGLGQAINWYEKDEKS